MEVTKLMWKNKKTHSRLIKKITRKLSKMLGCCIGEGVIMGSNVRFPHNAIGTVINSSTVLEDDVIVYQNVTCGRSDIFSKEPISIVVKKGAVLCAGAKILCKSNEELVIGENSIIGANAVLTKSVPPGEIWGGIPARKISDRRL